MAGGEWQVESDKCPTAMFADNESDHFECHVSRIEAPEGGHSSGDHDGKVASWF